MMGRGNPLFGCVLSSLLFSLYTNDCTSKRPLCQAPEVRRWHHTYRPHSGRWRVCLQTGGWAAGCLVQSQQPGAQHAQNSGDDHVLQEKPPCSPPTQHHGQHCGCSGDIQVPGIHHLPGPELGHSHRLHLKKKSPTKVVLPSPAEEV